MIPLRSEIQPTDDLSIRCYLPSSTLTDSDQKEFAANAKYEASLLDQADEWVAFQDVLFKADFTKAFLALMPKLELSGSETILELGASHGWASAIIKKQYPGSYVVASDLVVDTVRHTSRWERLFGCSLDEKWALNCRDLPFESGQFDRIFTFASFHHFDRRLWSGVGRDAACFEAARKNRSSIRAFVARVLIPIGFCEG